MPEFLAQLPDHLCGRARGFQILVEGRQTLIEDALGFLVEFFDRLCSWAMRGGSHVLFYSSHFRPDKHIVLTASCAGRRSARAQLDHLPLKLRHGQTLSKRP